VQAVGLDRSAQRFAEREQVRLAHELVDGPRAHAVGQRAQIGAGVCEQIRIAINHGGTSES
jgi:hypothetical protein